MHKNQRFYLTAALACSSLFLITACDDKKPMEAAHAPPVTVIDVIAQNVPANLEFVAKTESSRAVEIYSRVTGFLDQRVYTEGGIVKDGQILFLMDKRPFEVQLKEAEASLASSKAAHLVAQQNLDRIRPLAKLKALSQSDLDSAEGQFQTSAAQVSDAQAKVESAKLNLSYCTIESPVTGYAGSALQTDGTYINTSNSHLTTVYAMDPMWVIFSMSENQEAKLSREVREGLLQVPADNHFIAEVQLTDGNTYGYPGRLTFASPNYNPSTGTFEIRASFPNPDNLLKPQQYVRIVVKGATYPNSIIVPQVSVQQGGKGHFVWVINNEGRAENRPVTVGSWVGENWLITSGLQAGDKVVTQGMLLLAPDSPVTVVADVKQEQIKLEEPEVHMEPEFMQEGNEIIESVPPADMKGGSDAESPAEIEKKEDSNPMYPSGPMPSQTISALQPTLQKASHRLSISPVIEMGNFSAMPPELVPHAKVTHEKVTHIPKKSSHKARRTTKRATG
ncbi:MAG: efflux RND transporter periplasmic adaptor subunit [Burkholderiales bacterium]|nr:efflux RND transporter periplasmic adaptor subunit [Burkholderiales bacterium]